MASTPKQKAAALKWYYEHREQVLLRKKASRTLEHRAKDREYYAKNRERIRSYRRDWQRAHPESTRLYRQSLLEPGERRERHLQTRRNWRASQKAGSLERYNELLAEQNHACAICGSLNGEKKYRLAWDHDHQTNEFRGLLCGDCNMGLGQFKDNPEILEKAKQYLLRGRKTLAASGNGGASCR